MVKEMGSLMITGAYKDLNMLSSIKKIKIEFRDLESMSSNTGNELKRLSIATKLVASTLSLIGLGGFATLFDSMPRVNAMLRLAHTYLKLIGLEMDKYLAPLAEGIKNVFKWLYEKYKDSPPWLQRVLAGLTLLSAIVVPIATLAFVALILKVHEVHKALEILGGWLGNAWKWFTTAVAGSFLFQVAIGILLGLLAVFAMDKMGVFDALSKWAEGFRKARDEGNLLARVVTFILSPIALLGTFILALVGARSWDQFKNDWTVAKDNAIALWKTLKDFVTFLLMIAGIANPLEGVFTAITIFMASKGFTTLKTWISDAPGQVDKLIKKIKAIPDAVKSLAESTLPEWALKLLGLSSSSSTSGIGSGSSGSSGVSSTYSGTVKAASNTINSQEIADSVSTKVSKSVVNTANTAVDTRVSTWSSTVNSIVSSGSAILKSVGSFLGFHDTGGMASYTGLHWLKAGETVVPSSSGGNSKSESGPVNIVNNFGGVTLNNGMDLKKFSETISRVQSEEAAWRRK